MQNFIDPWDIVGKGNFNTKKKLSEIDPVAADNILVAWPSLLAQINKEFPNPKGIKALDFGCGTGAFCTKLDQMGFSVTGLDPSREMVRIGRDNSEKSIKYILGDKSKIPQRGKYGLIVSIMVMPFIEEIGNTIKTLSKHLKKNGLLLIADFNRNWVSACLKKNVSFADFDSKAVPKSGHMVIADIQIPVFIRTGADFDKIANNSGLAKIMEDFPPFTQSFIDSYPDSRPKDVPEYLILGYKKK